MKTYNAERLRVKGTGTHPGVVGIGTSSPEKALHIKTLHSFGGEPPVAGCIGPFPPLDCALPVGGDEGSHNGIRLEDISSYAGGFTQNSKWDIVPAYGSLIFGKGDPTSSAYDGQIGTKPEVVISSLGYLGVGGNPKEKFQIGNIFTFHDRASKVIARNYYYNGGDKRIEQGKASAMYFYPDGSLCFKVAEDGAADSPINWIDGLLVRNDGNTSLNGKDLLLHHTHCGLGYYGNDPIGGVYNKLFNGVEINGPVLYGSNGGALGSNNLYGESIALRWDMNGNVGIGSTIPAKKLHIKAVHTGSLSGSGEVVVSTGSHQGIRLENEIVSSDPIPVHIASSLWDIEPIVVNSVNRFTIGTPGNPLFAITENDGVNIKTKLRIGTLSNPPVNRAVQSKIKIRG